MFDVYSLICIHILLKSICSMILNNGRGDIEIGGGYRSWGFGGGGIGGGYGGGGLKLPINIGANWNSEVIIYIEKVESEFY